MLSWIEFELKQNFWLFMIYLILMIQLDFDNMINYDIEILLFGKKCFFMKHSIFQNANTSNSNLLKSELDI